MQKFDARQTISRDTLANLLGINGTELDDLLTAINKEFNAPLRIAATYPTPDSKINFLASNVEAADKAGKAPSPISSQIPSVVDSTIDFQTGVTTGATFNITFPNSTVGQFRRVGFSLDASGVIQVLFSDEATSLSALANPGTVFVKNAFPIGWIDLEATSASPGRFKTAGSTTSIIENSVGGVARVNRVVGGGGAGGSGNVNEELINLRTTHSESPYVFLASSIFAADETDFVNDVNTTATFSVADSLYELDSGEVLYLDDLLDSSYDSTLHVLKDVAVVIFFNGTPNIGGTAEVSLDGGANWQTITLQQNNDANQLYGEVTFTTIPVSPDIRFRFTASAACEITGVGVLYGNEYGAALPPLQERIVGSLVEVNAGIALFTQISEAIASLGSGGGKIRLLSGTFVENVTINSDNVLIEGSGWSSKIQGDVIINGDYNILSKLTVEGNIENNGDNNEFDIIWDV